MVPIISVVGGIGLIGSEPVVGQESPTASTPEPGEVAQAIAADGWYADSPENREELADVATRLSARSEPIGFAILDAEPEGSSTAYAEDVLDELAPNGESRIDTVVVLSPADVGVVSDTWDEDAIDAALDDALDDLRSNPTDGLEALATALAREPTMTEQDSSESDDGDGGISAGWLVVIGIGVVALIAFGRIFPQLSGDSDGDWDDDWDSRSYRRRRRLRGYSRSSLFSGSRRSSSTRTRRSSGRSRRGRGGRRL